MTTLVENMIDMFQVNIQGTFSNNVGGDDRGDRFNPWTHGAHSTVKT